MSRSLSLVACILRAAVNRRLSKHLPHMVDDSIIEHQTKRPTSVDRKSLRFPRTCVQLRTFSQTKKHYLCSRHRQFEVLDCGRSRLTVSPCRPIQIWPNQVVISCDRAVSGIDCSASPPLPSPEKSKNDVTLEAVQAEEAPSRTPRPFASSSS